jgi:hypothetical protein
MRKLRLLAYGLTVLVSTYLPQEPETGSQIHLIRRLHARGHRRP